MAHTGKKTSCQRNMITREQISQVLSSGSKNLIVNQRQVAPLRERNTPIPTPTSTVNEPRFASIGCSLLSKSQADDSVGVSRRNGCSQTETHVSKQKGKNSEHNGKPSFVRRSLFSQSPQNVSEGREGFESNRQVLESTQRENTLELNENTSSEPNTETSAEIELHNHTPNGGGYNTTNRRRLRGTNEKNEKGRGPNKTKALTQRVYVDVNEKLQPIGDSARQLSTLIGCLARDPRRLPLDCFDWRKMKINHEDKLHAIWVEVKRSYYFPEGREPYEWALEKMNACWRCYKSELKVALFDDKTLDDAKNNKPEHIPEDTWLNMVKFWISDEGKARTQRGIENRSNLKMCHYAGTKSFSRIRAEKKEKTGEEPDSLDIWLETHEPKKGSKLDDASAAAKDEIMKELASQPEGTCDKDARSEIFKKVIGEDKNGYAKTHGLGVKVSRSRAKRCALEEERAKRIRSEEKYHKLEKELIDTKSQLGVLTDWVKKILEHQGLEYNDPTHGVENIEDEDDYENEFEDVI